MALLAGGAEISSKVTGTTATVPSPQLICRTTRTTRVSGGKYGASTETSSTQCNVSQTDRRCIRVYSVAYVLTSICLYNVCLFFSSSENREDMLCPSNNKLTEVLEQANKLFKDGKCYM